MDSKTLVWKDEYSVNVKEIDEQHKQMFAIINQLVQVINSTPNKETVNEIIGKIVEYKKIHFATEEKYFKEFNFEGMADHVSAHQKFNDKVAEVTAKNKDDVIALAFELVDFLEDWLIGHLMNMDQKYKKCFNEHGLY